MARKYGFYINGQYVHAQKWSLVPHSSSPDKILGEVSFFDSQHDDPDLVEAAIEGLYQSFLQIRDSGFFPLSERIEFLKRLMQRLKDQRENLALLVMNEVGKPIALARAEIDRGIETLNETISVSSMFFENERLAQHSNSTQKSFEIFRTREARGVLLAITPFNFPINLVLHKLAPAIAAGCPVFLKPSPKSVLSALCLVDFCHAEGLPAGLLNVVNTSNTDTLNVLKDKRIAHISFTGSSAVGWQLAKETTKKISLELGGAAPAYVDKTASLKEAAQSLAKSAVSFAGQSCISTQSIHVHPEVYEKFLDFFDVATKEIKWGNPLNPDTLCGPLVDDKNKIRVLELVETLKKDGAQEHLYKGELDSEGTLEQTLLQPRYFTGLPADHSFLQNECFAPLVAILKCSNELVFLERANQMSHRLQCSLFMDDKKIPSSLIKSLDFGGIVINEAPSTRLDHMPYGGRGLAGSGREGPLYALEEFSDWKVVLSRVQSE